MTIRRSTLERIIREEARQQALLEADMRSLEMLVEYSVSGDQNDRAKLIADSLAKFKGKGLLSVDAACDAAINSVNEYISKGTFRNIRSFFSGGKMTGSSPLDKAETLAAALHDAFVNLPGLLTRGGLDEKEARDPKYKDMTLYQILADQKKADAITRLLTAAFTNRGVLGRLAAIPYLDTKRVIKEIMNELKPASKILDISKAMVAVPAPDAKNLQAAQDAADKKSAEQGDKGGKGGNQQGQQPGKKGPGGNAQAGSQQAPGAAPAAGAGGSPGKPGAAGGPPPLPGMEGGLPSFQALKDQVSKSSGVGADKVAQVLGVLSQAGEVKLENRNGRLHLVVGRRERLLIEADTGKVMSAATANKVELMKRLKGLIQKANVGVSDSEASQVIGALLQMNKIKSAATPGAPQKPASGAVVNPFAPAKDDNAMPQKPQAAAGGQTAAGSQQAAPAQAAATAQPSASGQQAPASGGGMTLDQIKNQAKNARVSTKVFDAVVAALKGGRFLKEAKRNLDTDRIAKMISNDAGVKAAVASQSKTPRKPEEVTPQEIENNPAVRTIINLLSKNNKVKSAEDIGKEGQEMSTGEANESIRRSVRVVLRDLRAKGVI